jgi:hypothetical protein
MRKFALNQTGREAVKDFVETHERFPGLLPVEAYYEAAERSRNTEDSNCYSERTYVVMEGRVARGGIDKHLPLLNDRMFVTLAEVMPV